MRRITLIFALLLSLMGVRQANAETVTESFENWDSSVGEGWTLINDATFGNSYSYDYVVGSSDFTPATGSKCLANSGHSAAQGTTTSPMIVTPAMTGKLTFQYRKYNSSSSTKGYINVFEYDEESGTAIGSSIWTCRPNGVYEATSTYQTATISVGETPKRYAIYLAKVSVDDFTYTPVEESVDGPALAVYDGTTKLTTPYEFNFGLSTAGTTKEFTLKNPGTAEISVSITAENFAVTPTKANISAGGEQTLTVTMPEASANDVITITPNAEGLDPFVINVSGIVRDGNKLFIDFADGTIPTGWTSVALGSYASSYGSAWSAREGYVSQSGGSSSYEWAFQSPKLNFAEGETLLFQTSKYGSSTYYTPSIKVEYSVDGSSWTQIGSAFTDDVYGTWTQRSVNIPTADAKYIRFSGWYVNLTNIYGGELPMEPNMVFSAEDYNFGMISEEKTTDAYIIKNEGRAELTDLTVTSSNANFVVALDANSIDANSTTTFTVSMKADAVGAQEGTITVSAPGQTDVTFNVIGYVLDNSKLVITFDDNAAPEGWENTGWSFANGVATGSYTSSTTSRNSEIITPAVEVAEGDVLAIEAKGNGSYAELYVYTSTDNGATWTKVKDFNSVVRANTTDYSVLIADGFEAGTYKLKFEGYSVSVNTINGFNYDLNAPELTIDPTTDAAFGKVKASDSKTYTITNSGTGTLTGTITSSDETQFTVSESEFSLGAGESMTFDVILVFDENYGEKSATISVVPSYDEAAAVVINATATTSDPNVWEEDFEGGTVPARWIANGWTVTNSNYGNNGTYMLAAGTSTTVAITPRLYAEKDQVLTFEVGGADSTDPLTVKWASSNDAAEDEWNLIGVITTTGEQSFTAPETGYYYISFQGKYSSVDNFEGFKLDLPAHEAAITATTIPATGTQFAEYTASVTVKEQAGKSEELTAKFFIGETQCGESVVETVNANGTKTFTVTFTPEEAISGDAYFTVTNDDIELTSEKKAVEIAPASVLDETAASVITTGTVDALVLKYTPKNGWNTICVPFALTDDILNQIFGEGWKAYEFDSYNDGVFTFQKAGKNYGYVAGYPYLVFTENAQAATDGYKLVNINITAATANGDERGGVTFQGTYAKIEAPDMAGKYGVVPNTNDVPTIMKGGASATLKGYRGYFEIPSGEVKSFSFTFVDDATGIRQFVATPENGAIYDLNGNKVKNLVKGQVYIMNGQKILVK